MARKRTRKIMEHLVFLNVNKKVDLSSIFLEEVPTLKFVVQEIVNINVLNRVTCSTIMSHVLYIV